MHVKRDLASGKNWNLLMKRSMLQTTKMLKMRSMLTMPSIYADSTCAAIDCHVDSVDYSGDWIEGLSQSSRMLLLSMWSQWKFGLDVCEVI